jgi:hypothetical protein
MARPTLPRPARPLLAFVSGCLLLAGNLDWASAGDLGRVFEGLVAPFKAAHRQPPKTCQDEVFERINGEIDWLEHEIDAYGSIVAKQPDVWGQSRLMRHRHEYEEQMRRQLPLFAERSQAAIRRSDQAFLGMALAMQSATGRRRGNEFVATPDAGGSNAAIASIQALLPTTNEQAGRSDPLVIARTAPFAGSSLPSGMEFDEEPLALEPALHLDHLSRYLNHLNELRRINEGDDSADSPGYALNLVRIPVSILTGGKTRKGHGAEITISVDPCLDDSLLPTTFRSLVINDLVDLIAPPLTHCVNDPECLAWAATIAAPPAASTTGPERAGLMAAMQSLSARLPTISPGTAPSIKTRRARMPIPVSQLVEVAGIRQIATLILASREALASHPASRPCIEYLDVRGLLAEELEAAADFLALDQHCDLWTQLPGWQIPDLVRGRRSDELARIRCHALTSIGSAADPETAPAEVAPPVLDAGRADLPAAGDCCDEPLPAKPLCRSLTAVLAWAILVESALLDDRLVDDMRDVGGGFETAAPFSGPDPGPAAREAFAGYVRRRWPIRIFALDPVTDEQNVDDAFARRREMQIVMAMAFASGRANAQALQRYTRRLETDMAAVAVNKTAVGFTHGSDTFGWRFMPRVQTPPSRNTLATFTETLCGGPTSDGDLMQRQLEQGIRECAAIVVMPSFVPRLTLDVRSNWFSLAHPRVTDQSLRQTMRLSRSVRAIQHELASCRCCGDCSLEREKAMLMRRVEQLERELPLQTLDARVPYENTCGGFELFTQGLTDLAPELIGWYGAPGIDPDATTTLFLIGKGFSVHDTAVIAGGRPAACTLLSREVLEVEIPAGARAIGGDAPCGCSPGGCHLCRRTPSRQRIALVAGAEPLPEPTPNSIVLPHGCPADCNQRAFVDIHLATPYGVSSHLLVPLVRQAGSDSGGCSLVLQPAGTIGLTFSAARTTGSKIESARVDEFFSLDGDRIVIRAPRVFVPPTKAALQWILRDSTTGVTAATFSFEPLAFDARESCYVIAGGDLRNFIGDTSRPATDKTLRGGIKPYLDSLLAQGDLAETGDARSLTLTATLVADGQSIPVEGTLPVQISRRGKTIIEPTAE